MSKLCALEHYGFLGITGKDCVKFLQGYATCDLQTLNNGRLAMGAICNIKGRMLTSFLILKQDDTLLLRMHRPLVSRTIEFLGQYIVFSKAELVDLSDKYRCYGAFDCEQMTSNTFEVSGNNIEVSLGTPGTLATRREHWVGSDAEPEVNTPATEWTAAEISDGFAWVQPRTSEEFLPQMFNYHEFGAIDFEKGCYLGQEIVARMQYRGELKRRLHRLESKVQRETGTRLGEGTVVATSWNTDICHLLAVIQNTTEAPLDVTFEDGESVTATPC
jgi:folate-binding protein YgfZ